MVCVLSTVLPFMVEGLKTFSAAQQGYEVVGPSGLIFPHEFHQTQ